MPQFNTSAYLSITTWTIIIIICLLIVMKKDIIPSIIEVLYLRNYKFKEKSLDKKEKLYNL